jgi:hypothetical protein
MFEKTCRANLLTIAKCYAKATGKTLPVVSAQFYGNRAFLPDLARGEGSISIRQYDKMLRKFRKAWPDDEVTWPSLPVIFIGRH